MPVGALFYTKESGLVMGFVLGLDGIGSRCFLKETATGEPRFTGCCRWLSHAVLIGIFLPAAENI